MARGGRPFVQENLFCSPIRPPFARPTRALFYFCFVDRRLYRKLPRTRALLRFPSPSIRKLRTRHTYLWQTSNGWEFWKLVMYTLMSPVQHTLVFSKVVTFPPVVFIAATWWKYILANNQMLFLVKYNK